MEDQLQDELIRLGRARKRDRIINLALVFGINVAIILTLYAFTPEIVRSSSTAEWSSSAVYQIQPELLAFQSRTFHQPSPDPRVEDLLWSNAVSFDTGFVWINDADNLGLPAGLPGGQSGEFKLYGLSWGHQMHCLMMIRDEYRALVQNASSFIYDHELLELTERARLHHIDHCFHYLRENIHCNRDMTLEWAAGYPDELGNPNHIDGYDIAHQCRNENLVERFTANHQPLNDVGLGLHNHQPFGKG